MGLANRTYEDDAYDTIRLPFEAVYTLLANLGVDLGARRCSWGRGETTREELSVTTGRTREEPTVVVVCQQRNCGGQLWKFL